MVEGWGVGERRLAPPAPTAYGPGMYTHVRMYLSYIYICTRISGHTQALKTELNQWKTFTNSLCRYKMCTGWTMKCFICMNIKCVSSQINHLRVVTEMDLVFQRLINASEQKWKNLTKMRSF